jgi:hypothetical protein
MRRLYYLETCPPDRLELISYPGWGIDSIRADKGWYNGDTIPPPKGHAPIYESFPTYL